MKIAIKRLKNHINSKSLVKVVDGFFTSKINYGLQLYGKAKLTEEDTTNGELETIQKVQNKMARFLNSKTLKYKIPSLCQSNKCKDQVTRNLESIEH